MKLIIDIPDYEYRQIKEIYEKNDIVESTYSYIYHGTPLDDVKAEIEELKSCCDDDWDAFLVGRKEAYNNVLQIIDKHIGKAESEDKE